MVNVKQQSLKVVIVDDSPLIVDRLQKMLNGLEHVAVAGTASNIGSGFVLIKDTMPDVVILDIYLEDDAPEATGIALLTILAEDFPQIEVIMLTNLSGPLYKSKCIKTGAKHFLDKSEDFERIPEILDNIIQSIK